MRGERATGFAAGRDGPIVASGLLAGVTVAAMWGPWFASGSATRNSFGFFRAAQVLGIEWVTPFRIAWFLLPVVLALAAALAVFGARRSAGVTLLLLGVVVGGAGVLSMAGFGLFWGAAVAAGAGVGTVVAAIVALMASTVWHPPGRPSRAATSVSTRG